MSDAQAAAWLRANPHQEQASLTDPDKRCEQIVRYMVRLIDWSIADPTLPAVWRTALQNFLAFAGGDPALVPWWFAKYTIRFIHHQRLLVDWLGLPNELQLLISPDALLRLERPVGDCAVFTCLICAMLSHAGYDWEIVTVAVNPRMPDEFSHVYPQLVREDGERVPLDASHGKYPGWQVPSYDVSKKKSGTDLATKFRQWRIAA